MGYIKQGGNQTEGYVRVTTVYSRAKRGYSKLCADIACISALRTRESCRNAFKVFVEDEGGLRLLGHRKRPNLKKQGEKKNQVRRKKLLRINQSTLVKQLCATKNAALFAAIDLGIIRINLKFRFAGSYAG